MDTMKLTLLILGCGMFGWMLPEILAAISPTGAKFRAATNTFTAAAAMFLAAYFGMGRDCIP
jgi:hypothetical protein